MSLLSVPLPSGETYYIVTNSSGTLEVTSVPGGNMYLGQVATRSYLPNQQSAPGTWMMRTLHYARTDISSLQVAWPGWFVNNGVETPLASAVTITASIEFPVGTFTQVKWSGVASGTIQPGVTLMSDLLGLLQTIPAGSPFYIRMFWTGTVGIPFTPGNVPVVAAGDATNGPAATDQTLGGTVLNTVTAGIFPVAIIGRTASPTIAILGDSRQVGSGEAVLDGDENTGEVPRIVGPEFAYMCLAGPGETTAAFIGSHTRRLALSAFCSAVVVGHGINDVDAGISPATIEFNLTTIYNLFPGKPVYQTTLPPVTTSTDAWITTVNQTPNANNANRVSVNNSIRGNFSGLTYAFLEVADVMESFRDSGLWAVHIPAGSAAGLSGNNAYTTDGVHETSFANRLTANALKLFPPPARIAGT